MTIRSCLGLSLNVRDRCGVLAQSALPEAKLGTKHQSRVSRVHYNSSQSTEAPEISGEELSRA